MVWGTFCNAWKKRARYKTRKCQENPEETPQDKTITWSCSAYVTEENQVNSWRMKWEQIWALPSRPALCTEGRLQQVSMAELQQINHCWDHKIRWKDWNLKGKTKIERLNNGIGYSGMMNQSELFGSRDANSYTEDQNIMTCNVWRLLWNMGEALWLSGVVSQLLLSGNL